jgi:hypothetical protein
MANRRENFTAGFLSEPATPKAKEYVAESRGC